MNPYFAPGPDERRPIVERVPECRPRWLSFDSGVYWHEQLADSRGLCIPFGPDIALALCRVAVEDWLRNSAVCIELSDADPGDDEEPEHVQLGWYPVTGPEPRVADESCRCEHDDGGSVPPITMLWYGGLTIHDALNAAAHAAADALNIPH